MSESEPAFTVSELAKRSGTPLSSIKFYLREELLPPANLNASHRAFYSEVHLRRLPVIKVLREVAGLSIPAIREICTLLDGEGSRDLFKVIVHVIDALGRREARAPSRDVLAARKDVLETLEAKGIRVRRNARAVLDLADALVGLRHTLGPDVSASVFLPYLDAMRALAKSDFEANQHLVTDAASAALGATYGTVLWEPVLLLLRRIAHEHEAMQVFGPRGRRKDKGG
jgi:DNA-binding transcriptional MerR regulator